jgi:hypothetical protein
MKDGDPGQLVEFEKYPHLSTFVFLKARLHLQFLLRFLVRFSASDACERVNELRNVRSTCTLI